MARKQRDYKAEYAAAKKRATAAGYKSQREYKTARKALRTPRNVSPVPRTVAERSLRAEGGLTQARAEQARIRRLRLESRDWSRKHSKVNTSSYSPSMSDDRVEAYHVAYVAEPPGDDRDAREEARLEWLHDYLVPNFYTEEQWQELYPPD